MACDFTEPSEIIGGYDIIIKSYPADVVSEVQALVKVESYFQTKRVVLNHTDTFCTLIFVCDQN